MQQGGMYWNGIRYVPTKGAGTYQNGMYFQYGGAPAYTMMADGGTPPANTDVAIPYTANGMTQWQGQGIDFRSPNPNAVQIPMMNKPLIPMPQMPSIGNNQQMYGYPGAGAPQQKVGIGAAGDVFGNAHGQFKKGGIYIKPDISHRPFYKNGGIVEGSFDIDEPLSPQEINYLRAQGYDIQY